MRLALLLFRSRAGATVPFVRRIFEKPLSVIAFRLFQWFNLFLIRVLKGWRWFAFVADRRWREDAAERFATLNQEKKETMLTEKDLRTAKHFYQKHPEQSALLHDEFLKVRSGQVEVFGESVKIQPLTDTLWYTDWRCNHIWPRKYYRSYDHYDPNRKNHYDIKFPWELSRLRFFGGSNFTGGSRV